MNIEPIGYFHGDADYKFEVPRQGAFHAGHVGVIELLPGKNFELALRDIGGFERLWILFLFHKNEGWRPTTRPPVPPQDHDRVGIFASRSPYRPNPVGLSCVRLLKADGLRLEIDEADLIDGTPVIDIKPYIPAADSFPLARAGWVDTQTHDLWRITADADFTAQSDWLLARTGFDLLNFAQVQLADSPFDSTRKRVRITGGNTAELAYRTFRIDFEYSQEAKEISLTKIRSGYSADDLKKEEDPYGDKSLHRELLKTFGKD